MHDPDEFYRFNKVDEDKKIGAVVRDGHFYLQIIQESAPYQAKTDSSTSLTMYVGYAIPGTGTDEAKWQLFRMIEQADGSLSKTYADQDFGFTKVWDDRAGYTY